VTDRQEEFFISLYRLMANYSAYINQLGGIQFSYDDSKKVFQLPAGFATKGSHLRLDFQTKHSLNRPDITNYHTEDLQD